MDYDVAIVGAGAAGLGAARELTRAGAACVVLEARARIGGRGHSVTPSGDLHLDLGCGWLHSADRNPMAAVAQAEGLTLDKTPAAWGEAAPGFGMSPAERAAFGQAMGEMIARIEAAAQEPEDRPASQLLDTSSPWNPLLNAFSAYYNGAEFDQVSARDYAAFDDDGTNWRVLEGYGRAIVGLGAGLEIATETPVARIEHGGPRLRLSTPRGVVEAAFAIITIPTDVLAAGAIDFSPALPEVLEAAARLPLGLANKVFIALDEPDALPRDSHIFGRIDSTETGSYYLRPFGRPLVEAYLGGRHARALEAEGPRAAAAFAIEELAALMGSRSRFTLHPIAASRWASDPWARGAYSHALPGHADARARLAQPVGRLLFAGEATSPHGFSTAHGAYQEGLRAAGAVLAMLRH